MRRIQTYTRDNDELDSSRGSRRSGRNSIGDSFFKSPHLSTLARINNDYRNRKNDNSPRRHVPDQLLGWEDTTDGVPEEMFDRLKHLIGDAMSQRSCKYWVETFVPMYRWLRTYDYKNDIVSDIISGLTVGLMVIPQSMSYAKLAGLPVIFGLYSSLVPIFIYSIFGSSRQLAIGPVALVSLLLKTGLEFALESSGKTFENTENYEEIYINMALQTSFLVGVAYIIMGVLRLGFITIFLSHAVVSGFTSAAAIIIGLSQLKYVFGYSISSTKTVHTLLINIFKDIDQFNWRSFLMGSFCLGVLLTIKKISQTYKKLKWMRAAGPLLVTVLAIVLQATVDLEDKGIEIVGKIPRGLPKYTGDKAVSSDNFGSLVVVVISIVIIGFMESIAISRQLASKNNYTVDPSTELIALGMASLFAGLFSGYPVAGSFSRSAVSNDTGSKSQISGLVTGTMVMMVLLFLTPVFELLALPTLASIVISGVLSLVDYQAAMYLWRVHKFDFSVWITAFLGTLFVGVELGLGIAVGLSLLLVIFESAYPHTVELGRLPGTSEYRNIKQYKEAERYDGIVAVRIDSPLYFANTQTLRDKVFKYYDRAQEKLETNECSSSKKVKFIILELSAVSHIDTAALHVLEEMIEQLSLSDVTLCLSNPNRQVMKRLVISGVAEQLGKDNIFVCVQDAVVSCLRAMDALESLESQQFSEDSVVTEKFPLSLYEELNVEAVESDVANDKESSNYS